MRELTESESVGIPFQGNGPCLEGTRSISKRGKCSDALLKQVDARRRIEASKLVLGTWSSRDNAPTSMGKVPFAKLLLMRRTLSYQMPDFHPCSLGASATMTLIRDNIRLQTPLLLFSPFQAGSHSFNCHNTSEPWLPHSSAPPAQLSGLEHLLHRVDEQASRA